jgi:hypothetical protein
MKFPIVNDSIYELIVCLRTKDKSTLCIDNHSLDNTIFISMNRNDSETLKSKMES